MSALVKGSSVADMDMWAGLSEAVATNPENVVADATHRILPTPLRLLILTSTPNITNATTPS